ncbi:MAG TPA: PGPGW domain-containing protein [Myxococcaceae bacterium]|nr:PGPGW domain-containing protein [Myxococcaceae bacterium]
MPRPASERTPLQRLLLRAGGWALIGAGVVLIPLPGPGWAVVLTGLAVLAQESPRARRLLLRVRREFKKRGVPLPGWPRSSPRASPGRAREAR